MFDTYPESRIEIYSRLFFTDGLLTEDQFNQLKAHAIRVNTKITERNNGRKITLIALNAQTELRRDRAFKRDGNALPLDWFEKIGDNFRKLNERLRKVVINMHSADIIYSFVDTTELTPDEVEKIVLNAIQKNRACGSV